MKKITLICLLLFSIVFVQAQEKKFYKEIQNFKKQDSLIFPPKDAILFIGSSSFTNWKDVQNYFPTHTIINRGFGGSSLPDVINYADDIIFPYQPKQVIIYCGENDFTVPGGLAPSVVVERVRQLVDLIRSHYPKIPIAYISMKPSLSRQNLLPAMQEANAMIKKMMKKKRKTTYINIYNAMLNADGTIMKDIFLADNLHMNAKGYAIWQKIIEPYLK